MKAPALTPGPWRTVDYLARAEEIQGPKGEVLVMRQDNAKLGDMLAMAAAPDLLEALRVLLECREYGALQPDADAWDIASAAIAKATGATA